MKDKLFITHRCVNAYIKVCLYQVQKATIARIGLLILKEGRIRLERSNVSLSLLFVSHSWHKCSYCCTYEAIQIKRKKWMKFSTHSVVLENGIFRASKKFPNRGGTEKGKSSGSEKILKIL